MRFGTFELLFVACSFTMSSDLNDEGKHSLSATKLAIHHHLKCDLFLHNSYHGHEIGSFRKKSGKIKESKVGELVKAQFKRGNAWEKALFAWLDAQGLLLHVHSSGPLEPSEIKDIISFDERPHFFIAGLYFKPPSDAFAGRFAGNGFTPVEFGIAKPDLLEVKRANGKTQWQVIDAKASKEVKVRKTYAALCRINANLLSSRLHIMFKSTSTTCALNIHCQTHGLHRWETLPFGYPLRLCTVRVLPISRPSMGYRPFQYRYSPSHWTTSFSKSSLPSCKHLDRT